MSSLESVQIPRTKDDIKNNKRRYTVKFKKQIETIGIYTLHAKISALTTDIARDIFVPQSNIIQINDTVVTELISSETIDDLIMSCKNNPGSFMILECSNNLFKKGIHFQLNLRFIVSKFTEVPLKQITLPKLEAVISRICKNKPVNIYDIMYAQNFAGLIIFAFISDPCNDCQFILNDIQNELDSYNTLRKQIIDIFQVNIGKEVPHATNSRFFDWNLSQIYALSQCFVPKIGLAGSDPNVMKQFWEIYTSITNKQDITKQRDKIRKLIHWSMNCFAAWQFAYDEPTNVYINKYQRDLWLEIMTNWFYENIILKYGSLTYSDFSANYSLYLKQFYEHILNKKEPTIETITINSNIAVYGYLNECINDYCLFIPNEITDLIKIYFCDIPIQISLPRYTVDYQYKEINWNFENAIPMKQLTKVVITKDGSWAVLVGSLNDYHKFMNAFRNRDGCNGSVVFKDIAMCIAIGKCEGEGATKCIPEKDKNELNKNYFIEFV